MRIYTQLLSTCMNEYNDPLFTFDYSMAKEYKPIFERMFLLRFGYRNIGFETFPLFKQMLESSLCELMPKYLKLYESANVPFNPFLNNIIEGETFRRDKGRKKDYATSNNKSIGFTDNSTGSFNNGGRGTSGGSNESNLSTNTGNVKNKGIKDHGKSEIDLFSDTPQNKKGDNFDPTAEKISENYFNDGYLTTKKYDQESSTDIFSDNSDTFNRESKENSNEMYENVSTYENAISQANTINRGQIYSDNEQVGAIQNTSKQFYNESALRGVLTSDAIQAWRKTFINIDKMLLDELEELFIGVF